MVGDISDGNTTALAGAATATLFEGGQKVATVQTQGEIIDKEKKTIRTNTTKHKVKRKPQQKNARQNSGKQEERQLVVVHLHQKIKN